MKVKFLYAPVRPSDVFDKGVVPVLPLFVSEGSLEQYNNGHRIPVQDLARRFLRKGGLSFIALPERLTLMLLTVKGRHDKRHILRKVRELYSDVVDHEMNEYVGDLRGLKNVTLVPFHDYAPTTYRFWNSNRGVIVSTSDEEQDAYVRSLLRTPECAAFTAASLKHPGILYEFEQTLIRACAKRGLDILFSSVAFYNNKVLIAAEIYGVDEYDDESL